MYTAELIKNPHNFTDEQIAFGRLAYKISKKYENKSLGDEEATEAHWKELVDAGFAGLYLPEEYGGLGESMLTLCLVFEQTSAAGRPAHRLVRGQSICSTIFLRNGSREQCDRWLPGVVSGKTHFAFGLTEAHSGSNAPKMKTTARQKGNKWIIKGEKTYISEVDKCGALLLAARTPEANGGITLFVCDFPNPQITTQRVYLNNMVSYAKQFTLFIDDLELGPDAVVGEVGKGMKYLFDGLNPERLLVASQAVGLGRWGIEKAVAYASRRQVFDDVIGKYQAIQHPLGEAYALLEGAWALTVAAARQYDTGSQAGDEANAAKLIATDAGFFAMDRALQTHGGSGYTTETMILEKYLIARLIKSAPISREMALNHIARSSLGLPKSY